MRHPRARVQDGVSAISGNLSMFVRMYDLDYRRFQTELDCFLAAVPAPRPWRAEPAIIQGDAATQRVVFTLEGGREAPCIIRTTRAQLHYPPDNWFIDAITPDTS